MWMLTDYPLRLTAFGTSLPLLAFGHFPLIGGIGPRKGGGKFPKIEKCVYYEPPFFFPL